MPVSQLEDVLSSVELSELVAYDRLVIPPAVKTEYYFALIAWILCEVNRNTSKKPTAYKLKDFLIRPRGRKRKKPQTEEEMFTILSQLVTTLGGAFHGDDSQAQRATNG